MTARVDQQRSQGRALPGSQDPTPVAVNTSAITANVPAMKAATTTTASAELWSFTVGRV